MTKRQQRRWAGWAGTAGVAALGFYWLPLFHVVPLHTARQQAAAAAFDAEAFVETFWNERLLKAEGQAIEAGRLLAALRHDPAAARQLGRRLGLSRTTCYLVAGTGRIAAVTPDAVAIALDGDAAEASVQIQLGPVFGHAIRDGSGLLDVSRFPNSQDFNAISTALNRRVETGVLPALPARAAIGTSVRFLGCAEVEDPATGTPPLRVVPIRIEWP